MQKLGILGGTFNPVHWGHLLSAETALDQQALDQVIWVPTHHPPHRSPAKLVAVEHRVEMIRRAIASHPAFSLSRVDLDRPGVSYALDTLRDLQALYGDTQWYWIIGLDAFQSLPRWYHRQTLALQCCWLVIPRLTAASTTASFDTLCEAVVQQMADQSITLRWVPLQMPLVEISSSLIRHYCGDRRSIRYLVPDSVFDYITSHHLYEPHQHDKSI